ncbi:hypothetical protein GCM10022225_10540 [Plantactinospora mayteni]|uniref:Uncharacterized protein n=1 Tax=Plantactinospora mayteni TaxID=566021 RepID=A0ABQ4EHJ0_9ACTN|nr:hypothetical protein Pma05_07690 [Plantactinospora mayteni]
MPASQTVEALDALLHRIPAVPGVEALHIVGETAKLAFPGGPVGDDVPFAALDALDALDERQRRLVRQLADHEQVWQIDGCSSATSGRWSAGTACRTSTSRSGRTPARGSRAPADAVTGSP